MDQLILHLLGDYVTQNHWMAVNKTKSSLPCLLHVTLYSLPFLLLRPGWAAFAVIAVSHFVLDRFSVAKRWPAFYGVGCEGWLWAKWREYRCAKAVNAEQCERFNLSWPPPSDAQVEKIRDEYQVPAPAPDFLAVWLAIIVDNTCHLTLNYLALAWL